LLLQFRQDFIRGQQERDRRQKELTLWSQCKWNQQNNAPSLEKGVEPDL
jgi:hypothetical protein